LGNFGNGKPACRQAGWEIAPSPKLTMNTGSEFRAQAESKFPITNLPAGSQVPKFQNQKNGR
jgi:hypothetical protein